MQPGRDWALDPNIRVQQLLPQNPAVLQPFQAGVVETDISSQMYCATVTLASHQCKVAMQKKSFHLLRANISTKGPLMTIFIESRRDVWIKRRGRNWEIIPEVKTEMGEDWNGIEIWKWTGTSILYIYMCRKNRRYERPVMASIDYRRRFLIKVSRFLIMNIIRGSMRCKVQQLTLYWLLNTLATCKRTSTSAMKAAEYLGSQGKTGPELWLIMGEPRTIFQQLSALRHILILV
jgi:hypothetical protein